MIKLAILGIDNSHAWGFSSKLDPKEGEKIFDDVELIGVYGDYSTEDGKKAVEEIKKTSNCVRFAEHYNDFLDEADAIMVTARHGGLHLEYAREYIKKGIPVWIDKPITCSTQEACEMVELAKEHGCPITGGSGVPLLPEMTQLRENIKSFKDNILGGHVTAPLNMDNPYGGFWFYTQHLVQMMTSVFGTQVRRAEAVKEEKGVSAKYYYDNFNVTAFFGAGYTVTVYTNAYGAAATEVTVAGEFYVPELKEFYNVIKSGKSNMTYNEFIAPVYIIDATIKAFSENKTVELSIPY